jgi:hypothetical protein
MTDMSGTLIEGRSELAAALAAFQAELPQVGKGNKAKIEGQSKQGKDFSINYSYADLATMAKIVLPAIARHGLSFTAKPVFRSGGYVLECSLLHTSGEREVAEWELPTRVDAKALGSAMTYGRRYCLMALTGIHPDEEDDDGHTAPAPTLGGFQVDDLICSIDVSTLSEFPTVWQYVVRQEAVQLRGKDGETPLDAAESVIRGWLDEAIAARDEDRLKLLWQTLRAAKILGHAPADEGSYADQIAAAKAKIEQDRQAEAPQIPAVAADLGIQGNEDPAGSA